MSSRPVCLSGGVTISTSVQELLTSHNYSALFGDMTLFFMFCYMNSPAELAQGHVACLTPPASAQWGLSGTHLVWHWPWALRTVGAWLSQGS